MLVVGEGHAPLDDRIADYERFVGGGL